LKLATERSSEARKRVRVGARDDETRAMDEIEIERESE